MCPVVQMQSPRDLGADAWHVDNMVHGDPEATDTFEDDRVTPMEHIITKTHSRRLSRYSHDDRQRGRGFDRSATDVDTDASSQKYRRSRQRNSMISNSSLNAVKRPPRSHSVPWSHHRSPLREEPQVPEHATHPHIDSDDNSSEDEADSDAFGTRHSQSAVPHGRASPAMKNSGSRSSKGSVSTIIQSTFVDRGDTPKTEVPRKRLASSTISTRVSPPIVQVHDALRYLDEDSPDVTEESIRRSVAEASAVWRLSSASSAKSNRSPSAPNTSPGSSSSSSGDSGRSSDLVRDHESDRSSSPARSINEAETSLQSSSANRVSVVTTAEPKERKHIRRPSHEQYGTPEMPRGKAQLPHIPPKALKSRTPSQPPAMHLPRAEKLPLSGYELLAARVSSASQTDHGNGRGSRARRGSVGSSVSAASTTPLTPFQNHPPLKPIYRRFEALNHRLLLQLQDELSELEEQLHRLDTADTQTRRVQNQILPASRRAGIVAGGELQWHRTEVLAKIGYKLAQYNHVLTSFTETQKLPSPAADDVENYRTYLAAKNPIAEIEARFLDTADDLVSLAPPRPPSPRSSICHTLQQHYASHQQPPTPDDALTSLPGPGPSLSHSPAKWSYGHDGPHDDQVRQPAEKDKAASSASSRGGKDGFRILVAAAAVSVLVPVLAFPLIPSFMARVVVVLIVALTLLRLYGGDGKSGIALPKQARDIINNLSTRDIVLTMGSYGAVMTVIAGII
ncbi:uncharacterized protein PpBr36_06532 [Pyricularia pennisetigena]|uniref:uncharacterized protein n=1 Tax=Pyricularia pennisetigena TaxID=1578925 RepID=UPI001152FF25|nr:uncharacterized protein PpBr36_06532 [Pyricularia pennisetigena]TLS23629.1 hypothetical protein PpBr36_06532 [Pyricularia pennisetigena]